MGHSPRWLAFLIGLLWIAGCTHQDENAEFRLALNSHQVQAVSVYHVTRNVTTRVDMSPENIEAGYDAKLELRASAFQNSIPELDRALASTSCKELTAPAEVRTAIIFLAGDGKRIKSFYYGADGKTGRIDERSCKMSPGLYDWVIKRLPE